MNLPVILNKKIFRNSPNVDLGTALRLLLDKSKPDERQIRERCVEELLDRDYNQLGSLLEKLFRLMNQAGVGMDYGLFCQAKEVWGKGDEEIRYIIARTVWGGKQGDFRVGSGAKTGSTDGPLGISHVGPDVVHIVNTVAGSKTEFIEKAIRYYW